MGDLKKVQAVFIDRDGTMGGDTDVTYPDKFVLYPFTQKAIKMLKMNGIRVFAFTNQPGISAGEATEEDFINELEQFGIEKAYICPHTPEHNCKCRKPEAGLLLKAKAEYALDLSRVFVVGDRWSDMMAAKRANMGKILVLTGAGNETLGKDRERWSQIDPDYIANNVLEAAQWIVENKSMDICLIKATLDDAETIHAMQIKSFMDLLSKYQDFETSPANESIEKTVMRINQAFTDYYIIKRDNTPVGCIRIVKKDNKLYRVSPIFILPEYQGFGIAQKSFKIIEEIYCDAKVWELDTILQESRNCYLYEKLGYVKTGRTKIINSKMTLVFYEKHLQS